ncbi:inorganic phosphate transporter [Arthrobacter mobilis]|uniref:Inorganic phosphate transporter n=1 Tax=Arthrobacter mobilis TaxID=2724944 RepID=A0A7X6HG47_9MICC|nr:inorganic phosphate transporter [Arthrobacter mobilis]NKX55067.1 inorganic phosphate transporter [Arthrobacter mobilis]
MELFLLAVVVLAAGCFAFINGFHDVSNSVATPIRNRALTPGIAVVLAALFNFTGVLLSSGVAVLFSKSLLGLPEGTAGLGILLAGLASACGWGVWTWWRRMPSSSTHALLGGLLGAGAASAFLGTGGVLSGDGLVWRQLALPLLLSPVLAFVLSYLAAYAATWAVRFRTPSEVHHGTRMTEAVLAGAFSLGHGMQDGQRTMSMLLLALTAAGFLADDAGMPLWIPLFAAVLLAAGSLCGGWRISHTLGSRLVRIDPLRGATAQGISSAMLFLGAVTLHMPLSSTHTMAAAILGAGANQRFGTVRWRVVIRMLRIWVATAFVTALFGAVFYLALDPLL